MPDASRVAEPVPDNATGIESVLLSAGNLFSGPDGADVRTAPGQLPPIIPQGESIYDQMNLVYDVSVRVFDLTKSEDLKDYTEIMNQLGHRQAELSVEERHWSEKNNNWVIFLRWAKRVFQAPTPPGKPIKSETFHGQRRTVIG